MSESEAAQPLDGIRVVELAEGIAGPYAGKLLADYGAEVIKVEPPEGDRARRVGPFPDALESAAPESEAGLQDPLEQSSLFLHLNTNKRSVVTDDEALLDDLLAWADVVIQSKPEPSPDELRARHKDLVIASVTAFGLTGPHAGFVGEEIVHYAYGGPMSATGAADREPLKMGASIGQYQCGTVAAVSILAGLGMAARTGDGTHIDLANVETQIGSIDRRMTYLLYAAYRGANVDRQAGYNMSPLPGGSRPTQDGFVQVSTLMNWIPRMLAVLDNPDMSELYEDPGFIFNEALPELADAHLLGWTLTRGRQAAMEEAQAGGWPITAINQPIDLLSDRHFEERGFFVPVEHPVAGTVRQPGPPIRFDDGWKLRRPAPTLGQHTDEVAAELAAPASETASQLAAEPVAAPSAATSPALPLDGIRVHDMTVVWAGPYTTCMLGDLGAEVVRVDNPFIFPSATRGVLPRPPKEIIQDIGGIFGGYPAGEPGERPWNRIALFNAHARNKKSVTLDLRNDLGRETFLRLVDTCDVMVENNSVDLLEKLGIGWDTLHKRNPRLVMVRMPSVGLVGPYRSYLGFGINFEGLCGLTAIRGYRDVDPSEGEPAYHMDAASGSAGAFAVLAALHRRRSTGVGELIELSQSENMLNHIGELLIDADRTGTAHEPLGNRHHQYAPQGCYRCQGEDRWVVISVTDDDAWARFAQAAGNPPWSSDPRFATEAGRQEHHDELDTLITSWTEQHSDREIFLACQQNQVAAAPVLTELDAMSDEHLAARGMFYDNGNDEIGTHRHPGTLWHWDGPDLARGPIPVLGGDNELVFKEWLGLTDQEYDDLAEGGHLSRDYLAPDGSSL
ncbi:MAG: CaiB/BaiF CoA transferase family protein [Acidimicrobiales bacterium]